MEKRGLERYSYSSGLTLPLPSSGTPVPPFGLRSFGFGDGVQVRCACLVLEKHSRQEKEGTFLLAVCENNVRRLMVS